MNRIYIQRLVTTFTAMVWVMLAVTHIASARSSVFDDHLLMGKAAMQDELYELAAKHFRRAAGTARDTPTLAEARLQQAQALYHQGALTESLSVIRDHWKQAENTRWFTGYIYWKAFLLFEEERYDESLEELEKSLGMPANDPNKGLCERLKAKIYVKRGDFQRATGALTVFDKYFADSDQAAENLLDMAGLYIRLNQRQQAFSTLERITQRYPEHTASSRSLLWQAELYLQTNDFSTAEERLNTFLTMSNLSKEAFSEGQLYQAYIALRTGRAEEAEDLISPQLEHPVNTELEARALALHARILLEKDAVEQGRQQLIKAHILQPGHPWVEEAQLSLADRLYNRQNWTNALHEYGVYLESFTNPAGYASALLGKGNSLYQLERYIEAATAFEQTAQRYAGQDTAADALFLAADARYLAGHYRRAYSNLTELTTTFRDHPLLPEARFRMAECLQQTDQADAAVDTFASLNEDMPGHALSLEGLLRAAEILSSRGTFDRALDIYNLAGESATSTYWKVMAQHGMGMTLYQMNRLDEALDVFTTLSEMDSGLSHLEHAMYMKAMTLYVMGDYEQALEQCTSFLEEYTDSVWAEHVAFWMGEYYFNRSDYRKAEEILSRAAIQYPDGKLLDNIVYSAGRSAFFLKEYVRCIDYMKQLIDVRPASKLLAEARFTQGDAMSELGRFSDALVVFDEIIRNAPNSYLVPLALGRQGDCYYTLGSDDPSRYREAVTSYETVLATPSISTELRLQALYKLGRCYAKMDDTEQALDYYTRAVYQYKADIKHNRPGAAPWFTRAAFSAAHLLEKREQWREAVRFYRHIAEAKVSASEEAEAKIQQIRIDHWLLF